MTEDARALARATDPDTAREAAAAAKSRAREIAQQIVKGLYPSAVTARALADLAVGYYPDEVRDEPGYLSTETIRRRWHELTDGRYSPDGRPWGEIVYRKHPDGSVVVDAAGRPVPVRFLNPLGNSARVIRWIPR